MIRRRSKMRLKSRGWLLFMLLLAAALPGCRKKETPPPQVTPLPKKPAQTQAAVPAAPVLKGVSSARNLAAVNPVQKQLSSAARRLPPGSVALDFNNRRDPFKPYIQAPAQQAASGKAGRTRIKDPLPIQRFDTEKFRVTGIITGLRENSALVVDPGNKGYVIKAGMPIGSNDGRVKRVTNSTVEVEEVFRDDGGRVRKRLVKLVLISSSASKKK